MNLSIGKFNSLKVTGEVVSLRADWIWGVILFAAVLLVYQPVWYCGYIWDDDVMITVNPVVMGPLGLKEIWTTSAADICPLTLTTFWVEHALWGLRPVPYHLVNVFLHGLSALVLWRVLRSLHVPGAWLGAALWAVHPVEVESVAWITELKNVQSGLFFFLSILFFLRWLKARDLDAPTGWNYGLALLFAALAMASKSSTVVLPGVLCLSAWWVEGRWRWRNLTKVAPVFLMSLAASGLTVWTQRLLLATDPGSQGMRTWPERVATAGVAIWFYLGKLLWPHPLLAVYPRWQIDAAQWFSYLPLLALIVILFLLWLKRESWSRPWFFVLAYFVMALLPSLGLVDMTFLMYSFVSDHFQYLASMGPLALAGAGLARFSPSVLPGKELQRAAAAAFLFLLGVLSWHHVWTYENEETLWTHTLAWNPNAWLGYNNLAGFLYQKGQIDDAIGQYRKAVEVNPTFALAYNNLGSALFQKGDGDGAIDQFHKALEINPHLALARNNLGLALDQKGKVDEAIEQYQKAIEISPVFTEAYYNLGNALVQKGRVDDAIVQFKKALEINPNNAGDCDNLGNILLKKGRVDEAIEEYQTALKINPYSAAAHYNLGSALSQKGQMEEAIIHFKTALKINPDYAEAHNNLGIALSQTGDLDGAIAQFREVVRLHPDDGHAQSNLARAQAARQGAGPK